MAKYLIDDDKGDHQCWQAVGGLYKVIRTILATCSYGGSVTVSKNVGEQDNEQ